MKYKLYPARQEEIEDIFSLYVKRVHWMDEHGIEQWNKTDYLNVYPVSYYEEQRKLGTLYVLKESKNGKVVGAVVLLSEDERWEDRKDNAAYYVHNLVTDPDEKGAGNEFLDIIEQFAVDGGKRFVRLDCAVNNAFLNRYYEAAGYVLSGTCKDGLYEGNRREKILKVE